MSYDNTEFESIGRFDYIRKYRLDVPKNVNGVSTR